MPKERNYHLEAIAFVSLGLGALVFLMTQIVPERVWKQRESTYLVTARFDNVGDLRLGAGVSMAGVEIGRVRHIDLDIARNKASVLMEVDARYSRIPTDSAASIYTQGFLGDKFVYLSSGVSRVYLHDRGSILTTHSPTSIDSLLRGVTGDQNSGHAQQSDF
jgi:phospholipid/cholesterol/gamma-HCH transport system substrate-binding protein